MKRAHVRVTGRVQGVFFREETRQRARSRGVAGWIRNMPDGTVEAVYEGDDDAVDSLVEWSRRGPSGARVDDVAVDWEELRGESGFSVG